MGELLDAQWVRAMLEVEAALARLAGLDCADEIAAFDVDVAALGEAATASGNPVVPLVVALRERFGEEVHRGATSQDILDTAAMLVARRALAPLLTDLRAAADAAATLAERFRDTPMAGRTLLQRAVPITFGLKAAGWMSALDASARALADVPLAVQLGGPAGTLDGLPLEAPGALAAALGLDEPALPWHTDRGRIAALAGALGRASGSVGKVATDIVLLAQTEVGEVREGVPGRGGSSSMPHKANPIAAISARASARQAPGLVATLLASMEQEHERAAGAWHAEWLPLTTLLRTTGSAAAWLRDALEHLEVDPEAMARNLGPDAGSTGRAGELVDRALAARAGAPRGQEP